MILVTLGTQDKSFDRLLKAIDKEIENKNIKEKVIVQAGYTKYKSDNMKIFDLVSEEELEKLVKKCDLLITHGGVGSILLGIRNNKKVIAAARLKKYGEHTNDHQKQIIKEFKKLGYITELDDFNKLKKIIEEAKSKEPVKFKSNNAKMNNALDFTHKQNIGIEPVFNNYLESKDLPLFSKLLQYVRGSNCTLNATRAFGKDSILGTARNITMNPEKYGYKEVSSKEAVPGTLVIQSLPEVEDGPNNKYHSMILTGFASNSYENKFNDSSSENEMIYGYSNGEDSYRERPHNVLTTNHGKTKFRYYVPINQQGGILNNQLAINPNLFYADKITIILQIFFYILIVFYNISNCQSIFYML